MALFSRKQTSTELVKPSVGAAFGSLPYSNQQLYAGSGAGQNAGLQMVGQYYSYFEGPNRAAAMQSASINRARDLICSVAGSTYLEMYSETWDSATGEMVRTEMKPKDWLRQPDPAIPYVTFMEWLVDDLLFFGRAFLLITSRDEQGYPASMTRLPSAMVTCRDQPGPVFFAPSNQVYFQGGQIDEQELIQIISPVQSWLTSGEQTIRTALRLEESRLRNAESNLPSGVLKQTGGEPLSGQELADLSAAFNSARRLNQTAALSQDLDYIETKALPDNMLMVESSRFQVEELSRLTNVPSYLLGASIGSYSYTNSKSAREDLYLFAARPYLNVIQATLSMNNVLPKGVCVEFDIDDYLADYQPDGNQMEDNEQDENAMTSQPMTQTQNTQEALAQ
jgi:hypothetical protein